MGLRVCGLAGLRVFLVCVLCLAALPAYRQTCKPANLQTRQPLMTTPLPVRRGTGVLRSAAHKLALARIHIVQETLLPAAKVMVFGSTPLPAKLKASVVQV